MTKADSWMPFYVADYLRDTVHLSRDEHGAYMLLLMAAWTRGGRLPNEPARLAGMAKATPQEWRKLSPVILPFFRVEGGEIVHARVVKEFEKAQRLSEARRESGRKGGRPPKRTESEPEAKLEANGNLEVSQTGSQNASQTETPALVARPSPSHPPSEENSRAAFAREADPIEDDWPEADGDPRRVLASWATKLTLLAGPGLADPAKVGGLLTSSVEINKWRRAGCSWEADVIPIVVSRTREPRPDPISTWTFFTQAILAQASRRKAALVIPLQPESPSHGRPSPSPRPDSRQAAYAERLSRIDAAMAAAVEPAVGRR